MPVYAKVKRPLATQVTTSTKTIPTSIYAKVRPSSIQDVTKVWKPVAKKAAKRAKLQKIFLEPGEDDDEEVAQTRREELLLEVDDPSGACTYMPLDSFDELSGVLPEYAVRALGEMGIEQPLSVQAQALPIILHGRDVVGIARTGSGKTLAFLLPALPHLEAQGSMGGKSRPLALILAPTRELAVQISQVAEKLVQYSEGDSSFPDGLKAAVAYGGGPRWEQLAAVKACHILTATPGRLTDFLENFSLDLGGVSYFVLDEADRMLDMGFSGDVQGAAGRLRDERQTLFFSATWPPEVVELAEALCVGDAPVTIRSGQQEGKLTIRSEITQEVVVVDSALGWSKRDAFKKKRLNEHLRSALNEEGSKVLVFVSTKVFADELRDSLYEDGFKADSMHGGRTQEMRLKILEAFREGELQLLIATDVMGRGLDIPDVSHVVIYDMCDLDDYTHRIGRTCRGASEDMEGHALTFFEFDARWPDLAGRLCEVLQDAGQPVPAELEELAEAVARGEPPQPAKREWSDKQPAKREWSDKTAGKWEERKAGKWEERPAGKWEERPAGKWEERDASKWQEKPAGKWQEKPAGKWEERPAGKWQERDASKWQEKPAAKW